MVCRTMFISEPRIQLENDNQRLVIQIDYGTVVQEDGRIPKDEKLDFAECLIRNIDWKKVAEILKENNISGFKSISGWGAQIFETDKPDPYSIANELKTLELRIGYTVEQDVFLAAASSLRRSADPRIVVKAIDNVGKYFHTSYIGE